MVMAVAPTRCDTVACWLRGMSWAASGAARASSKVNPRARAILYYSIADAGMPPAAFSRALKRRLGLRARVLKDAAAALQRGPRSAEPALQGTDRKVVSRHVRVCKRQRATPQSGPLFLVPRGAPYLPGTHVQDNEPARHCKKPTRAGFTRYAGGMPPAAVFPCAKAPARPPGAS